MDKDPNEQEIRETLSESFPSNSKSQRYNKPTSSDSEKPAGKKLEKIVTGKVRKQKKGFGKKIAEAITEDDTQSVGSYIMYDVLIPAAKDLINDMIGGGLEMLLFGERRGTRTRREGGRSYTNYGGYSSPSYRTGQVDNRNRPREVSRVNRSRHDFGEVVLDTRGEAEEVLSQLYDLTLDYGQATVSDFYDLVGITSDFTDEKFGWVDLRSANVSRARGGGYTINFPRPIALE